MGAWHHDHLHYDFEGKNTGFGTSARAGDLAEVNYSDSTPDLKFTYELWGAPSEIDDVTGTRQFTYRESIDLLLQNEHLSTNGTALAQQEVTIPKYSVRLYDDGRSDLRKHFGTGGGAGLEHCVEFGYDQNTGRLAEVTHGGAGLPEAGFDYTYLQNSHLPEKLIGPVHTAERVYEGYRDALKSMVNEDKAGTPNNLATVTYGGTTAGTDAVNGIGQREAATFTGAAYSAVSRLGYYEYGYNPNGELVAGQRRDDSDDPMTGEGFDYEYDLIGNRLEASVDGSPVAEYTPNSHNQYEEIDSTTRVHDADGNLTDDGTLLYTWDAENRLVQVNLKSDNTLISKYRYDYRGRRVYKRVFSTATGGTAGETAFVYEGWNLAIEYPASSAVVGGTAAPVRAYTWGNDLSGNVQGAGGVGGLLAIEERDGTHEDIYYPLYDGNGNVTQLVKDGTGTEIVAHYEYDPFGNLTTSPTEQDQDSSGYHAVNPFRFSTKYFDAESGLYYYGYRFHSPETGRWLSRDPTEESGGTNLYTFCINRPSIGVDPDGEAIFLIVPLVAVIAIIALGDEAQAPGPDDPPRPPKDPKDLVQMIIEPEVVVEAALDVDLPDYLLVKSLLKDLCCNLYKWGKRGFKWKDKDGRWHYTKSPEDWAADDANRILKKHKESGVGAGARSGQHGTPYNRAATELDALAAEAEKCEQLSEYVETLRRKAKEFRAKAGDINHK